MIDMEWLWELLISVLFSVIVGAAKAFSGQEQGDAKWILGQLVISAAAGMLMTMFARGVLGLGGDLLFLAAGAAGWGGSLAIDALHKKTMAEIGVRTGKGEREE